MIYTIQNECLTVQAEDTGAQLASIRSAGGEEYLWQGDPAIWARRAPILFPLIGRLRTGAYWLDGVPYSISSHGFARDMPFALADRGADFLTFQLSDTPETRSVYPFSFSLSVTYRLEHNRLVKIHRVENRSDRDMLYEMGAHDGFRVPGPMAGWTVRLPGLDRAALYGMDQELMITPKGAPVPLRAGGLPLTPSTFGLDTMILDAPPQHQAVLTDPQGRPRVAVTAPDFPYLGIWTQDRPYDTGYVCIEPWSSLPDASFVGRELSDKAGVRRLSPGQEETLTYTTTIYEV